MSEVDLVIYALALLLAVLGFFQGFIVSALSLAGLLAGGFAATRLSQYFLEDGNESPYAPLIGLCVAILLASLGGSLLQDVGRWTRERITMREGVAVDRMLGAILSSAVVFVVAWLASAVLVTMPQLRSVRPFITESQVITYLNTKFPPSGPVLNVLARYDPFPAFDGPTITTKPPDRGLPRDPQVRAAASSVVRVVGEACGFSVTGSGWVVAPERVVTNAHVVAGLDRPKVQLRGSNDLPGRVIAFDAEEDVAILAIPGLERRPLSTVVGDPKPGTSGAVLGYPENGPFTSRPARYSDTRTLRSDDIYGQGAFNRRISSFRADVRHGNSGGPVVDGEGRVLTTVFASTVGGTAGGYGVPNDNVLELAAEAREPVDTGPCTV